MTVNKAQDVQLTKQRIRSKILLRLKTQKEEDRKRKSKSIQEKLFRTLVFKKAKIIMFYVAFGGEVDTQDMIRQAQAQGKTVAVPVCARKRTIRPTLFNYRAKLRQGPYGIYEPAMKRFIDLKNLDLVIVPGLAFDKNGKRLGRGKGYYDRFLEDPSTRTPSVGLAFDFQILPSVPTTLHDMRVDKVIYA